MTHALLEVKHLDKHFGGLHVLKDINITVQEGEIVGILGPNGAGKTTLFNLLTGFIPADEGKCFCAASLCAKCVPTTS